MSNLTNPTGDSRPTVSRPAVNSELKVLVLKELAAMQTDIDVNRLFSVFRELNVEECKKVLKEIGDINNRVMDYSLHHGHLEIYEKRHLENRFVGKLFEFLDKNFIKAPEYVTSHTGGPVTIIYEYGN